MNSASPTGIQVSLRRGDVTAQIAQVGASLRMLRVGDVDLISPYPLDAPTPGCSGVVLAPWPNRIRDGRWTDDGTARQLAITEPKLGNASHGLLRFTAYEIEQTDAAATLRATILALTPMALGITGHGGFISQPLAIVVIGGLISSTVLTLIVLPTLYNLVEGAKERRQARKGGGADAAETGPAPDAPEGPDAGSAEKPGPAGVTVSADQLVLTEAETSVVAHGATLSRRELRERPWLSQ